MKICICISNVPDTTTKIKFVNNNTAFDNAGVQWIINPWDELALTRALDLKDANAGAIEKITVVNVGLADADPTIRKALAIGADNAIRINAEPKDAYFIATQLAEVIKKEAFDIILCGIESCDYNGSTVGGMLAEMLAYPSVSSASFLDIQNGQIIVKREIDGGQELLGTKLPFIAIVQKGIAKEPRIPSMRGIMTAKTKPLQVVEAVAGEPFLSYNSFELPKSKAACKKIDPENVKELVNLLHNEAKVI
ncbi:MAG: electron transfer flavoprotein subunit alpha [Bacteroidetes bacterium RIFOXYA12_FULL_35_11]|nr:MAG: electron transfer flavoprotein subunit alpha [Bacteroidetes bacterium GWF2_35_48]OFY78833.1 MAG: electron transfer flavoprotein subunit alpha [Bacteroidetes bacterium RIFOXYA12_FULL_35_11]OFY96106.1 MAG: electron transfer flavoprotein subunit alpha [Bacteroidetes bacterium RIFOXYB2_FULL_35_7]OFZ06533.1 MAG: electron transfer flavoprotein subunit alpha [Bacteroidetes bacterium RIFOXYC12_FULL_35_7]HBX50322.1 electron transfer flavoprotein subunit alpha [Bacteroidales bacterium]